VEIIKLLLDAQRCTDPQKFGPLSEYTIPSLKRFARKASVTFCVLKHNVALNFWQIRNHVNRELFYLSFTTLAARTDVL